MIEVGTKGALELVENDRHVAPVEGVDGYWCEIVPADDANPAIVIDQVGPIVAKLLQRESDSLRIAKALASRFEEVELIYTITETLGRTIELGEAAQKIVEAVSDVVGARRASIMVHDAETSQLRAVAGVGKDVVGFEPISVDDPESVAAKVFRDRSLMSFDPMGGDFKKTAASLERDYRGAAFLSVPIFYSAPDGNQRTVGVINLTDRAGTDIFGAQEIRLVSAIASQIGVAIENARLVARDLDRQKLRQELQLAHDLQQKLLPSPATLGPNVDTAAHCRQAESVGGDFYNYLKLPQGRIGVMLGDVSSHGFSSALIMALVLSAAGIHAEEAASPDDALRDLLESVKNELTETEMHLALFYGVADAATGVLRYANAGHPHAFRMSADGSHERLTATSPPLGLTEAGDIDAQTTQWIIGDDLLVLFSDGIADAVGESEEKFGEGRVLEIVRACREKPAASIVDAVVTAVNEFADSATDDRTVLVLRA